MLNTIAPLKAILNPPTNLKGFSGESVTLDVSLINQGDRGATIDVFIDPVAQDILSWCPSPKKRVALDPQQACEVSLLFEIPLEALPGSYPYTVVVDAPEHYPEDTPIHYSGSLEVLVKEQISVKSQKPTFSLYPATSPIQPLLIQSNQRQSLSVVVNNHSSRVDRFRLYCLDLNKKWFTIRYSHNELSDLGLVSSTDGLELNPGGEGKITVEFHYPVDAPAGCYLPTLQLISDNSPEQVFLDLVYLEVEPKLHLSAELETIVGKVSHNPGQYQLRLTNQGNSSRELAVSASSTDETNCCDYVCIPSSINLSIGETAIINLTVYPKRKWQRPFFGHDSLPFQINLQDLQKLPTPEKLPMGSLIWKARPLWHLLLWLIAGVSVLSGLGFFIWFAFFKPAPPPALAEFKPDSTSYTEGGKIRLNWTIANSDRIEQLVLFSKKDETAISPQVYDFRQGLPAELSRYCQISDRDLTCTNVDTGARLAGNYNFQLQLKAKSVQQPIEKQLDVVIQPKPLPEVVGFESPQLELEKGKPATLGWKIENFSQLALLQVMGQPENGKPQLLKTYDFQKQIPLELNEQCQSPVNETLVCSDVNIELPTQPANYEISLQLFSKSQKQLPLSETIQVQVKGTPLRITNFTLNARSSEVNPSAFLKVGEIVSLNWQVEGDDVKVKLEPLGDVPASGSRTLKATTGLSEVTLTAENEQGESVKRTFLIQVDAPKPIPKPTDSLPQLIPKSTFGR